MTDAECDHNHAMSWSENNEGWACEGCGNIFHLAPAASTPKCVHDWKPQEREMRTNGRFCRKCRLFEPDPFPPTPKCAWPGCDVPDNCPGHEQTRRPTPKETRAEEYRYVCGSCKITAVDEDGCCKTCGADTVLLPIECAQGHPPAATEATEERWPQEFIDAWMCSDDHPPECYYDCLDVARGVWERDDDRRRYFEAGMEYQKRRTK